jgi:curved DNA-binding protein CbpA
MTVEEARAIPGVAEGATKAEIKAAYLKLMKRVHPDAGGTDPPGPAHQRREGAVVGGMSSWMIYRRSRCSII